MRLLELYSRDGSMKNSNDLFQRQDDIEATFNPEAWEAAQEQQKWYEDNEMDSDSYIPVKRVIEKGEHEIDFTVLPEDSNEASPGYRGLQRVKRNAGHPDYDKNVMQEEPLFEPALTDDDASLIQDAHRRLGR